MNVICASGILTTRPLHARDIQIYRLCEDLTAILVCCMVVFSPWAFGTTEPWSIWTMNGCGYGLGLLLGIKLTIRWLKKYRPGKWASQEISLAEIATGRLQEPVRPATVHQVPTQHAPRNPLGMVVLTRVSVLLTFGILTYCFISAVNARAVFDPVLMTFEYRRCLMWLPHSFDRQRTWEAFWSCLALAFSFWAIHDWLPGKSDTEHRVDALPSVREQAPAPVRLRSLLWVQAISGGLLGLEGMVQRVSNSPKLLFAVEPQIHQSAIEQFASFAYRANGAQYFNLLWPVCLGFWWKLHRSAGVKPIAELLLLGCVITMAACPIVSSARGAALVDLAMLLTATLFLLLPARCWHRHQRPDINKRSPVWVVMFPACVLALGLGLGWKQMYPRMGDFKSGLAERDQLHERGRLIARDYPIFGTGPGSFERVFQLYLSTPDAYWPAQLHNDWLETRITFGWLGSGLIALAFLTVLLRWFGSGGIPADGPFVILIGLSLSGCLIQARWDFPLQVYSILFLFLVWCAVLSTLSREL